MDQSTEVQLAVINEKLDRLLQQGSDYETRLRNLEQFKWKLMGAAAALGGIAGWLGNQIPSS